MRCAAIGCICPDGGGIPRRAGLTKSGWPRFLYPLCRGIWRRYRKPVGLQLIDFSALVCASAKRLFSGPPAAGSIRPAVRCSVCCPRKSEKTPLEGWRVITPIRRSKRSRYKQAGFRFSSFTIHLLSPSSTSRIASWLRRPKHRRPASGIEETTTTTVSAASLTSCALGQFFLSTAAVFDFETGGDSLLWRAICSTTTKRQRLRYSWPFFFKSRSIGDESRLSAGLV